MILSYFPGTKESRNKVFESIATLDIFWLRWPDGERSSAVKVAETTWRMTRSTNPPYQALVTIGGKSAY